MGDTNIFKVLSDSHRGMILFTEMISKIALTITRISLDKSTATDTISAQKKRVMVVFIRISWAVV